MHFIAMPTIAVWCDIELDIPSITISEETKKPITNAEEENHHVWNFPFHQDLNFQSKESSSVLNYSNTSLAYLLFEIEVQSPPPELVA